jgi:hypothetical protein
VEQDGCGRTSSPQKASTHPAPKEHPDIEKNLPRVLPCTPKGIEQRISAEGIRDGARNATSGGSAANRISDAMACAPATRAHRQPGLSIGGIPAEITVGTAG